MNEEVLQLLAPVVKHFEGLAKVKKDGLVYPYICPAGYPTQGFGLLVSSMRVPPITRAEAERRLFLALPKYVQDALKLCPRLPLAGPYAIAAIADFTFNLGEPRLRSSTLRRKINAGDWSAVPAELRKWVWGGGQKLPGLVARREAEINLLKQGKLL
jgi:lysozyme